MRRDLQERAAGEGKPARARATPASSTPADRTKRIVGLIDGLSQRHRRLQVFQDMVTMMACAISNSVDKRHFEQREDLYLKCAQRYAPEELASFAEALAELTMLLEETGPDDVLGRLYMQLGLGNDLRGQFFTPMHVCDLMARITYAGGMREKVKERGFVTVNDPASGGGAMLLAFAKVMAEEGLNYQQQMHAIAVDIDFTAAMMSYVQMSLLHIPATVVHGNTLTVEEYSAWHTPAHVLGNWSYKLSRSPSAHVLNTDDSDAAEPDAPSPA